MPNTIFGRILITSLVVLSLFFGTLGYITNQLFIENLHHSKREQLKWQNYILLTSARIRGQGIIIEDELRESRFEAFESGLYGYITNQAGELLWQTYSSHSLAVDHTLLTVKDPQIGKADFALSPDYFAYRYTVLWEVKDDQPEYITFTVLEDRKPELARITEFQQQLVIWFSAIGVTLVVILLAVLRWGTQPLRQLAAKLKQVESGERDQLEGDYPRELQRLTRNLNQLLSTEKRQRERYHHTLSDLAHSLKTPLAVVQAELEGEHPDNTLVLEQVARMDEIIKHQLQRAVVAEPNKLGDKVSVLEAANRLTNALSKVYTEKNIHFDLAIDDSVLFVGDKRDLTEVLGNLLDNACKHCTAKVRITASSDDKMLLLEVHDDGFGIDADYREQLLNRGLRADTRHSGQGIGLDVARDIVASYQGELTIGDSPMGGALFSASFPL